MTSGDLCWQRFMHERDDWPERIRLWFDASTDELLGWGWHKLPADLDWHVRRDAREAGLVGEIVNWCEEQAAAVQAANADPAGAASRPEPVTAWALDADVASVEALRACGFEAAEAGYRHHVRSLGDGRPIAQPKMPVGYRIRAVDPAADLAGRVALHRVVWDPSKVTESSYGALTRHEPYRPDLDLVVEAPDGSFAAYALGWFDPIGRVGELEPVGTHPAHRRRGLARAVCLAALRRLADVGAETAVIYSAVAVTPRTDGTVTGALYTSLGMQSISLHRAFRR